MTPIITINSIRHPEAGYVVTALHDGRSINIRCVNASESDALQFVRTRVSSKYKRRCIIKVKPAG